MDMQTRLSTIVRISGMMYVSASTVPYINEFPSASSVGRYFLVLGNKPSRYDTKTMPPVARSTPVFAFRTVENKIVKEMIHKPNNHQHTMENIILCATELSQKYALYP